MGKGSAPRSGRYVKTSKDDKTSQEKYADNWDAVFGKELIIEARYPPDESVRPAPQIAETPCPRCNCCLRQKFDCNCGAVHDDYCVNCDRFVSIPPPDHIELSEIDRRCDFGRFPHEHSQEEKLKRIDEYIRKVRDFGTTLGGDEN
jgi:hypothetical protein